MKESKTLTFLVTVIRREPIMQFVSDVSGSVVQRILSRGMLRLLNGRSFVSFMKTSNGQLTLFPTKNFSLLFLTFSLLSFSFLRMLEGGLWPSKNKGEK